MESIVKVPDGFMARTILPLSFLFYLKKINPKAYFQWDEKKKSKKLTITGGGLKCNVQDSSGFKSILGDCVRFFTKNRQNKLFL